MKNTHGKSFGLLSLFIIFIYGTSILQMGCSKARVTPTPLNAYSPVNSYLQSKQQPEQSFEITQDGPGPIVGLLGTKIWGGKSCLVFPNGDSVSYPFTLKLVELYTPKDMIYYQVPTVSGNNALITGGEIRLRAMKNNTYLLLRPNPCMFQIEMRCANSTPLTAMHAFYGQNQSTPPPFLDNPLTLFTTNTASYTANIQLLGWINCGQLMGTNGGNSSPITFSSTTDDLTNVGIFIYIPSTHSVIQATNQSTIPIAVGTSIKIIAIGINGSGTLYYWNQNTTVTAGASFTITMTQTTDAALTALLNNL